MGYCNAPTSLGMMSNQFQDQVLRGSNSVVGPSGTSGRDRRHKPSNSEANVDRLVTKMQTVDWMNEAINQLFLVTNCRPVPSHCRPALSLCDISHNIAVHGIEFTFIEGSCLYVLECEHWHDIAGLLSADLCILGKYMHLAHSLVNSYVGVT